MGGISWSGHDDSLSTTPFITFKGKIVVKPGEIVCVRLAEEASVSREKAMAIGKKLIEANPKGYSDEPEANMSIVTPLPPGETEDLGTHVTCGLQGKRPWKGADGSEDVIDEQMMKYNGVEVELEVDSNKWNWLEGSEKNDDKTKVVFYQAANLTKASYIKIQNLRTELGLPMTDKIIELHVSLLGLTPTDGDFQMFRKRYCRNSKVWQPYEIITDQLKQADLQ